MVKRSVGAVALLVVWMLAACGDDTAGTKESGEVCTSSAECESGTCLTTTRECL